MVLVVKNPPANAGDVREMDLVPGLGRSPRGGNGNPCRYSCLENPQGQRSLAGYSPWARKSQTRLKQLNMHACNKMKSLGGSGESMSEQSCVKFSKWIKYFSMVICILGKEIQDL